MSFFEAVIKGHWLPLAIRQTILLTSILAEKGTLVEPVFLPLDTSSEDSDNTSDTVDRIYNYSRVLCHYGVLFEFRDAWTEGDGERVMRCWRLLMQVLSPNLAHQVKWHRFVNTRGDLGINIPCDLYSEHASLKSHFKEL